MPMPLTWARNYSNAYREEKSDKKTNRYQCSFITLSIVFAARRMYEWESGRGKESEVRWEEMDGMGWDEEQRKPKSNRK